MPVIVGKSDEFVKRVTCRNCSSVLEYVQSEVQKDYSTDYLGGKDYYNFITCPCCTKHVVVK